MFRQIEVAWPRRDVIGRPRRPVWRGRKRAAMSSPARCRPRPDRAATRIEAVSDPSICGNMARPCCRPLAAARSTPDRRARTCSRWRLPDRAATPPGFPGRARAAGRLAVRACARRARSRIAQTDDSRSRCPATPTTDAAESRGTRPVTGGSSSGPAAAVAGQADIGLGTDTAGSIRVPASACGCSGCADARRRARRRRLHLPSFDAVLADADARCSPAVARAAASSPGPPSPVRPARCRRPRPPNRCAPRSAGPRAGCCLPYHRTVARSRRTWHPRRDGAGPRRRHITGLLVAFRTVQQRAWSCTGLDHREPGALHPDVEARFRAARAWTRERGSAPPSNRRIQGQGA